MGKVKENLKKAGTWCKKHWKLVTGVAVGAAGVAAFSKAKKTWPTFEEEDVHEVLENYDVMSIEKWSDGETVVTAYVDDDDKPLTLVRDLGNVGEAFAEFIPGVNLDSHVQATYWIKD